MNRRVGCIDVADRDIGPVGELAPLLPREREQRRQHHRGQLDRDLVHPVERLVAGQSREHGAGALPDRGLVARKIVRRRDRCDRLALRGVARRIHADEAAAFHVGGLVLDLDAAKLGGIGGVIELDRHDVVVARYRPIGAVCALGAVVDRRLSPQARKQWLPRILLVDGRVADIDRPERLGQALARRRRCSRHGFLPDASGFGAGLVANPCGTRRFLHELAARGQYSEFRRSASGQARQSIVCVVKSGRSSPNDRPGLPSPPTRHRCLPGSWKRLRQRSGKNMSRQAERAVQISSACPLPDL